MGRKSLIRGAVGVVLTAILALPVVLITVPAQSATATVKADNFSFTPSYRKINRGDTVRWENPSNCENCANHTVTFTNGPSLDRQLAPGESVSYQFNEAPGKYYYYCRFHGSPGAGMAGTIEITAGSTSSPNLTATGTITRTITQTSTPRRTRSSTPRSTRSASVSSSPSASPSPSPSPSPTPTTFSPTPSPTETSESASPIPTTTETPTGSESSGNTQALLAIVGVLILGALGFLIYRRTLTP